MPILEEIVRAVPEEFEKTDPTTYKAEYDEHFKTVVGGEEDSSIFTPELKICRWGREAFFKISPRGDFVGKIPVEVGASQIEQIEIEEKLQKEKIRFYPVVEDDDQEGGGFEIETVLVEKPKTNQIVYDIDFSDNIEFCFVPPIDELTLPSDISKIITKRTATEGLDKDNNVLMSQPERSVGSYAVYLKNHSKMYSSGAKAEKYKTGKLFHIWRPKLIDGLNTEAWADMVVDEQAKTITITAPQSFLDSAVYPVRVDPTFGYTTLGSGTYSIQNLMNGFVGNPGVSADVTSLHAGLHSDWDSGDNVKMALYTNGGTRQSPQSVELSTGHGTAQFVQFNPTSGTIPVTAQDYVIAAWSDSVVSLRVDYTGSSGDSRYYTLTYGTWPSSVTWSDWAWRFSTYATYTTGPEIDSFDDDFVYPGQENVQVGGSGFGASKTGPAKIEIANNAVYGSATVKIELSTDSWADDAIQCDIPTNIGGLTAGPNNWVYVTNSSGDVSDAYQIDLDWEWGLRDEDAVAQQTNVSWTRAMSGSPPPLDNMILKSVSVYVGTLHTDQVRVAVYQGGSLSSGPAGATLLKDFGLTSGSGTSQWLTLLHTGADIPVNKTNPLWIVVKGNDSGFSLIYDGTTPVPCDFQQAEGRFASASISSDESVAYPATWPADGGTFSNYWYAFYLTFELKEGIEDDIYEVSAGDINAVYEVDATNIEDIYE